METVADTHIQIITLNEKERPVMEFKPLELDDQPRFNAITKQFPPYSDYNFVSLWSYDTNADTQIAFFADTISLKFRDYMTNEPFYTFIGQKNISQTADTLLKRAKKDGVTPHLQLIPEAVIASSPGLMTEFNLEDDRDNADYILSVDEIVSLEGNRYLKKRNMVNRFIRDYPEHQVSLLDLQQSKTRDQIIGLFKRWEMLKGNVNGESDHEFIALSRLIDASASFNTKSLGIYKSGSLIGMSIAEPVQDNHGIIHFEKADFTYKGVYEVLKREMAKVLKSEGCDYINFEQDLGIPGLRTSKELWNPVAMLHKYTISPK